MSRTIVINPEYQHLKNFIHSLPEIFLKEGEYLHDGRNKIKIFEIQGLRINVKRYRTPIIFNRLIYTYFRQPKAVRAYHYALLLQAKEINTPTPVAYILETHCGFLGYSYFISIQVSYPRRFYEFGNAIINTENEEIFKAFGKYTAGLHDQQVYHQDYSPGNILFDYANGQTEFCLVDINRMEFGPVSLKKGCANFARLWGPKVMFQIIAREYAKARNFNEEETCQEVLKARKKYWQKATRKRPPEFPVEL